MADHKITDFVDQSAIDGLNNLKREMLEVRDTYVQVANELLKGLKTPVEGLDQLESLTRKLAELQTLAAEATRRHSAAMDEQSRIAANTTNTISRQLMEQEKLNEKTREAYQRQDQVRDILAQAVSSYEDMRRRIASIIVQQDALNERKKNEKKLYETGAISQRQYEQSLADIIKKQQMLAAEKSQLEAYTRSEAKETGNASSSYNAMSQELSQMKRAYRELSEEDRNGEFGKNMLAEIKELTAHLKDVDASMGDFQRNVGDYAIACNNGVVVTESLNSVLGMEAATIGGCIEQNKALEEAKLRLNTADADYATTLERINGKIAENNQRISDVSAIMDKNATSVAEAEQQNRLLTAALKLVDTTSEGASKKIAEINAKIAENKKLIESTTPALNDAAKASSDLADKMLSLVGVNGRFGSSLMQLGKASGAGSVIEGLSIKVKALGQSIAGLLANPWVLTILGVVGVAAGAKWWYDYNEGLVEATRLTMDFTGKVGGDMKNLRSEITAVADIFNKDFKEVLNATDKLATQLGISYEDALGAIKEGFASNADAQGNFLSQVQQFAPALRDAGLDAREMVAVISQTRSGIFGEEGLRAIQIASDRLKRMPKAAADSLDAIGLSSEKMKKALADGSLSMMDAIKQVSAKLKEMPENSQAVGEAVYNLFGRKAAAGGLVAVEAIADVSTSLDEQKEKAGDLGKYMEQQMEAQAELQKVLAAVFDKSGGSFEEMKTKAMLFVTQGLTNMIKGCVNLVNKFVDLYNTTRAVRVAFNAITVAFKTIWNAGKFVINQLIDAFSALGTMVEGVLKWDPKMVADGYKKGLKALKANVTELGKEIASDFGEAASKSLKDEMQKIELENIEGSGKAADTVAASDKKSDPIEKADTKGLEKKAKEQLKILNNLNEATANAMEEGHEKELELIRVKYKKKISEIKGNSENEKNLRVKLLEQMDRELAECERKYQENLAKINTDNKLAAVKKNSQAELELKLLALAAEYEKEKREAKKNGADLSLIEAKYEESKRRLREEYAGYRVKDIEDGYAAEAVLADNAYNESINRLKAEYVEKLRLAGDNTKERERLEKEFERNSAQLTEDYAKQKAQSAVTMLEDVLATENLAVEDREKLERELATAKIALEKEVTDAIEAETNRQVEIDTEGRDKRMENAKQWLSVASEALNAVSGLASAIYDAKIQQIEDEIDAQTEASDKEQENISELVEKKVITEEEGEARKRAAEMQSAKKTEELEKKKAEMKHKQAVWDKANSVAQAGISTALAIMNALQTQPFPLGIAMAAIAGAMGAVQIATILATPIPKYAKGTSFHEGGLAIVGDAGRQEVVSYGGEMFITPDKPTVIDLPRGAEVFPDASRMAADLPSVSSRRDISPKVVVNNDYTSLQREVSAIGNLIKRQTRQQARNAYKNDYELLKAMRGI